MATTKISAPGLALPRAWRSLDLSAQRRVQLRRPLRKGRAGGFVVRAETSGCRIGGGYLLSRAPAVDIAAMKSWVG